MAMLFHSALNEDLKLWVEGEESGDVGMARTGARRACSKLEALKREGAKLARLEAEGVEQVRAFAAQVAETLGEWQERGAPAVLDRLRAAKEGAGDEEGGAG
eukprot:CAMPEP_0198585386 /NCGR_PEP_ID=MMETSP1462-20131121/129266_1 /TAXON_ID=1333877 /ORGANISM="Brandtodinium nutriculum, Strain RCC3387" /LENGTH=101 /DNA_ID=CAMNT_0044316827 /DNA_START=26 /DNA_END=327 /DNA_ORIENTATION=-